MSEAAPTYKLEKFEGPLDLLLSLIHKNKVSAEDIPISLICDQYLEYVARAEQLDMELAVEFLTMASELMLIKSKMLLPRSSPDEADPRADLADAIAKLAAVKKNAAKLALLYERYGGRTEKDTDEISVDKTYVADSDPALLYAAMRKILTYASSAAETIADKLVRPIVSTPIVPVQLKIVGIMKHFSSPDAEPTLGALLDDAVSRPDLVAIFIGVLELVRMKRLLIVEAPEEFADLRGTETKFISNPDYHGDEVYDFDPTAYSG